MSESRLANGASSLNVSILKCALFLSLTILVTVNIVLVNQSRNVNHENMYSATTAVFLIESIKLVINVVLLCICQGSLERSFSVLNTEVFTRWRETLKCSVPAFIYVLQNNLAYVALAYLDPGTFEVTLQIKLLTTALFMRLLLGKVLAAMQWASLFLLLIGVCLAEANEFEFSSTLVNSTRGNSTLPSATASNTALKYETLSRLNFLAQIRDITVAKTLNSPSNFLTGLSAAIAMTFTSALAGVYFEMLLKGSQSKNSAHNEALGVSLLWIRNVQMFLFSIPLSLLGCVVKDGNTLSHRGFFHGYDLRVWVIVATGSLGGVATALMLKFLDNIYKNFSSSLSIVLASFCAMYFSGKSYHQVFVMGGTMVCISLFLYYHFGEVSKGRKAVDTIRSGASANDSNA